MIKDAKNSNSIGEPYYWSNVYDDYHSDLESNKLAGAL
jgi:hypothetical protein